jgi:hypothetical protein
MQYHDCFLNFEHGENERANDAITGEVADWLELLERDCYYIPPREKLRRVGLL